jgi:hypothetical protein
MKRKKRRRRKKKKNGNARISGRNFESGDLKRKSDGHE